MAHPEDTDNATHPTTGAQDPAPPERPSAEDLAAPGPGDEQPTADRPSSDPSEVGAVAVRGQLSALSAALTAQRMQLQDLERALVDRIADVDDDRRRGEGMLHRASEAQRSALDARLRRRGWVTLLGFVVLLAMAAAIVLLQQSQIRALEHRIETLVGTPGQGPARSPATGADAPQRHRVDALSQQVARLSAATERVERLVETSEEDPAEIIAIGERIDALSNTVAQVSAGLQRLERRTGAADQPPAEPSPEAVALTQQIEQLEAKQRRVLDELQTLQAIPLPPQAHAAEQTPGTAATVTSSIDAEPAVETADASASPTILQTLAEQPYALQLIGFHDREDLDAFVAEAQLPPRVFVRTEQLRGRSWFALIHSLHPSHEAAAEAARGLAPELIALEPWIRTLPQGSELEIIGTGTAE